MMIIVVRWFVGCFCIVCVCCDVLSISGFGVRCRISVSFSGMISRLFR